MIMRDDNDDNYVQCKETNFRNTLCTPHMSMGLTQPGYTWKYAKESNIGINNLKWKLIPTHT